MEFGTLNNYVDGEWVESSAEMLDVDNPATGEVAGDTGHRTGAVYVPPQRGHGRQL